MVKFGGGGTVWETSLTTLISSSFVLRRKQRTPWDRPARSPHGGDNLFICSIARAESGHW